MSPAPTPQPPSVPDRHFRLGQALAIVMLIASPLIYLGLAYVMEMESLATGYAVDMTVYLLLAVSILLPSVSWLIERTQISSFREAIVRGKVELSRIYLTMVITRLALVEIIYIFGLVVYLVTAAYHAMLYFYPIGIAWSIVHWPRRRDYERIVQKLGAP